MHEEMLAAFDNVACNLFGEDDKLLIGNYDEHVDCVLQPYEAYAAIR